MDKDTLKRYQQIRRQHPTLSAKGAKAWQEEEARIASLPPLNWEELPRDQKHRTLLHIDGFYVLVTREQDWDYDFSGPRGTFQNHWQDGALENPRARHERGMYTYFMPATTEAEHVKSLLEMGYGRTQAHEMARQYVQEDLKIATDPEKEGYWAVLVKAEAWKEGVLLGRDCCGGIETNRPDDPLITRVIWDCIHEALREAKANLEKLKAS